MQKSVHDFINKYGLRTTPEARYIDLVSEIGELGKEILTATKYGKTEFARAANAETETEMGDCLFSLLALCAEMNINAEDALQKVLAKYEVRFVKKGDIGSGDFRHDSQ